MEHRFPALQPSDGQGHMGPAVRGHVGRPGLRVRGSGRHHRSGAPVRGVGQRRWHQVPPGPAHLSVRRRVRPRSPGACRAHRGPGRRCATRPRLDTKSARGGRDRRLAHDADHIRDAIAAKRAEAVVPNSPSRTRRLPSDTHFYKARHRVECRFSSFKRFRRIATHRKKTARNYRAVVTLTFTIVCLRQMPIGFRRSTR